MSRPASLATQLVHAGYVLVYSRRYRLTGNLPIGTYVTNMSEGHQKFCTEALHAIDLFCEDVDNQSRVHRFTPFSRRMRVYD
jgi:hypothetical protein